LPLHTFADAKAGEEKAQLCVLCHREAPDKRFVPLLDAQPADYLVAATTAFKTGQRKTSEPAMTTNLKPLSEADIRDIAEFFAGRPFPTEARNLEAASIAVGEKLVTQMQCAGCHKPTLLGGETTPRLAGQKPAYLVYQLEAFRDGRRIHPPGILMLKERADMENVASYLASLR
jgi:cytochrome c553